LIDGGGTGRGSSLFSAAADQDGVRPSTSFVSSLLSSCRFLRARGGETGFGGSLKGLPGGAGSNSASESRSTECVIGLLGFEGLIVSEIGFISVGDDIFL